MKPFLERLLIHENTLYTHYKDHELLYNVLENNAMYGDYESMNILGALFCNKGDMVTAMKYFEMATNYGYALSFYNLGLCYMHNNNIDQMLRCFMSSAEKGCIESYYELAKYYYDKMDYHNMFKYLLVGVDHNDKKSIMLLTKFYLEKNDNVNSIKFLQICRDHDCLTPEQSLILGNYYYDQKRYDDAVNLYMKSQQFEKIYDKMVECLTKLNRIDEKNTFVVNMANEYYPDACFSAGEYFEEIDENKAKEYYELGASLGNSKCIHMMGKFLMNEKQDELALTMLTKAVDFGETHAHEDIGKIYESQNNVDKMVEHYEKAKTTYGYFKLGCYYRSIDDVFMSLMHHTLAAKNGYSDSQHILADYYLRSKQYDTMHEYTQMLIDRIDSRGYYILAHYSEHMKQYDNVKTYLSKSAKLGYSKAKGDISSLIDGNSLLYRTLFYDMMNDEQKKKLNIDTENTLLIEEHNKQYLEEWKFVECIICLKNVMKCMFVEYKCKCTQKLCCNVCYKEIKKCPICREKIT